MANVNRVILIGNLTRDPQLKYLPNQTAVVEFGLATNRRYKGSNGEDRDEVCFVDVTAFGRSAEVINQYCQKGKQLYVEGRLKYDQWEDKQGGGKRSKLSVVVDNFQFLGGREQGQGGGAPAEGAPDEEPRPAPAPRQYPPRNTGSRPPAAAPPPQPQSPPFGDEQRLDENDIPF